MIEPKPLNGIKVVEMGTHIAAPTAARLMADWGADVIKVESVTGESYRTVGKVWRLPIDEDNNPMLQPTNMNKRSLSMNLKDPEAKEALLKLLEQADVFFTNTRPAALERLGLDYESVKDRCPRLVYAQFTAYGFEGPDKDAPGFDSASYWARGGMLGDWTPAEFTPGRPHPGFGDGTVAAMVLAGVIACLLRRETTGKGDYVTSSLYGAALWYNFGNIVEAQYEGNHTPVSRYSVVQQSTPVYRTADGRSFFMVEQQWAKKSPDFYRLVGMPELADDPLYTDPAAGRPHMKEIVQNLDAKFAQVPYSVVDEACNKLNIVHSYIATSEDVLKDPQAWDNDYLVKVRLEGGAEVIYPVTPVSFGSIDELPQNLAPHLGADSRSILEGLGYTDVQINEMRDRGAVNTHGE